MSLISACSGGKGGEVYSQVSPNAPEKPVEVFNLDNVEVKCPSGDCPEAIGVVLFLEATADGFRLHRCTAFLSSPTEALSNGHCYEPTFGEGHFFSQSHGYRKIARVKNRINQNGKDAALFELETPFEKVKTLKPAQGTSPTYKMLTGYFSASEGGSQIKLKLDKVECLVHRHEVEFPYDIGENPEMLRAFDCPGAQGNSGGPLMADVAGGTVEAIQQGIPNGTPRRQWVEATNLRCLSFFGPAASDCTAVSVQSIEARAREYEAQVQMQIHRRNAVDPTDNRDLRFQAKAYRLNGPDEDYEVLHFPECRLEKNPSEVIAIVSERIRVVRNEWAEATVVATDLSIAQAGLKASGGDMYTLKAAWLPAFAPYANPAHDPRRVFGTESDIALPLCPR